LLAGGSRANLHFLCKPFQVITLDGLLFEQDPASFSKELP
jgi:hypothetical protein